MLKLTLPAKVGRLNAYRPLLILWPFAPVALVYDLDDTFGEALPADVASAFRATGAVSKEQIQGFSALLIKQGVELKSIQYGDGHAGHIQSFETVQASQNKKERPLYRIRLNASHEPNVQFSTLIHELGHLYLGHLGPDKYLGIQGRQDRTHTQRELEAESVSYIVCQRNGVQSNSESYLAGYLETNAELGEVDIDTVLKAAGQIETILGLATPTTL